ncbi:MAG TPA: LysM peptidoglycan-binding domain-containing protein, partial [Verrucomicrobiae bacterium]|nr:LysM peptidoglycan-binding domain-containing protein [Verrucomicrobiae bacterium]
DLTIASTDDNVISKPQVVTTALKSRADIQSYTSATGDTISSVAAKFGVTSDSIRWSNNLTGDNLAAGTKLVIPPVNGLVYQVKTGDTADSLAAKYHASKDQIIAYNDGELSGLQIGEQIIIPNATVATIPSYSSSGGGGFLWGSGPMYGYNGYDFGYCTWYVATQISVPGNWGNASSWAYYARLSGWNVSKTPTVGSVAQTALAAGGEGHVAVVDGVNGSMVHIRDMNNYGDGGGWDRVGSGWVPVGEFQNYIAR